MSRPAWLQSYNLVVKGKQTKNVTGKLCWFYELNLNWSWFLHQLFLEPFNKMTGKSVNCKMIRITRADNFVISNQFYKSLHKFTHHRNILLILSFCGEWNWFPFLTIRRESFICMKRKLTIFPCQGVSQTIFHLILLIYESSS